MAKAIQIEISDEQLARLEKMVMQCGFETHAELFNNALALLEWAVKERSAGRSIVSVDEHSLRPQEVTMPFFDNIKKVN